MKQPVMWRMLYALAPVAVAGVYFFGWRVAVLLAVCTVAGVAAEYVTGRQRGQPVSTACLVTCVLYALSLPPLMPFWMAVVGIVVGILFGKEFFGGFGRNWANPAIVGRAFVYVCFPVEMTGRFAPTFGGWPGGFARWSWETLGTLPQTLAGVGGSVMDALSSATPMLARAKFGYDTPLADLLLGTIGGTFPGDFAPRVLGAGSIGEVSAAVMLLPAAYLLVTRTANWRLMLSPVLGAIIAVLALRHVGGFDGVPDVAFTLCSGGFVYGAVYMVTEPISGPKKPWAMAAYGAFIGFMIVLLRWRGQFSGAVGFAILLGNIVGPLLDKGARAWAARRKPKGDHKPPPEESAVPEGGAAT
jgi:Na+-transporting NADH:ubiquinone oxidoreductase subunit B